MSLNLIKAALLWGISHTVTEFPDNAFIQQRFLLFLSPNKTTTKTAY